MTRNKRSPINNPFDGNFTQLLREMEAARRQLDELPNDQEWTQDGLATLEDIRHCALRLAETAEICIRIFEGEK